MLTCYRVENGRVVACEGLPESAESLRWIDMQSPTSDEERAVEALVGINVPTRDEMREIEPSSRLYEVDGVLYMTALLLSRSQEEEPEAHSVTFVLTKRQLITIRYSDPAPFKTFNERLLRAHDSGEHSSWMQPPRVLIGLLETIVDRLADILESSGQKIDGVSKRIFKHPGTKTDSNDYPLVLHQIGRQGDLTFRARESIATLSRLVTYFDQASNELHCYGEIEGRLETLQKDLAALSDYAQFISSNVGFLLDGTLGIIGMEQNATIKIFSVMAVVLMPPTLVASIYGMNFQHMPELHWKLGYPMALCLMAVSAFLPYQFFKRKGWL